MVTPLLGSSRAIVGKIWLKKDRKIEITQTSWVHPEESRHYIAKEETFRFYVIFGGHAAVLSAKSNNLNMDS